MKWLFFSLITIMSFAAEAQSQGTANGRITNLTQIGSTVLYQVGGVATGTPICAFANPGRFAIDVRTDVGKAFQLTLQPPTGRILAQGSGYCTITPAFEDLFYVGFDR